MFSRLSNHFSRVTVLSLLFSFLIVGVGFSQTINAPTAPNPICAGNTFNLAYTITGTYTAGNVFTATLSNSSGGFPGTVVGSNSSTTGGNIFVNIPTSTTASANYVIQISSTNPVRTVLSNTFTVNLPPTLSAPTFTPTVFCYGDVFTINVTVATCSFNTLLSQNVFTAVLSDATGSFVSGTQDIGSTPANGSTTISATIPSAAAAGTAYRIRIKSSNPNNIVSPDNGTNLTINATTGTAGTAGNGQWYVSCYNGNNFDNYYGFYTETNLNFDTQTRWGLAASPSSATAGTGVAYTGCPIPVDQHSYSYKRTNFPCGYYQIDIPTHDDDVYLLVNGVQQYVHNGCCDAHTNVWRGFLGTASTVEFRLREGGGSSYLSASFSAAPNPLITSTPPSVCSGTSTALSVSSALTLSYAWTSTGAPVTPTTGSSVTSSPTGAPGSTTTYTVVGTDATTGCTVTKNIVATIVTAPTTIVSPTAVSLCPANPTATLTASGANTYSWSPTTGLTIPPGPGSVVTASPSITTTYTVTGSSGACAGTTPASVTVTVPTYPASTSYPSGTWNAYVFNNTNFTSYLGYYTESTLSFNTTTRWAVASGPGTANNATGTAYQGCTVTPTLYSMSFKRTGFTCGAANANYFQIDIPSHDDDVELRINNVSIATFAGGGGPHTNVWTGFLGPASTVEFRLVNTGGSGNLQVTIAPSSNSPLTVNSPITVCTGTQAHLAASSSISGGTYAWTPAGNVNQPTNPVTNAGPVNANTTYTVTFTDAAPGGTGCSASASVPVTVNATPTISITPAGPVTLTCPGQSVTLTAQGANNYFPWTPAAGLNTTAGFKVIATPDVTTTYTISGDNNCANGSASVQIINPFPVTTIFPTNTWNVYGFNTQTFTGYTGYYTENGSGTTGYDFSTLTRWATGTAPSTANATNGQAWQGCTMPATNISLSFKRSNFVCGIYTLDVTYHDDDFYLFINGVQVAAHAPGCCDVHNAVWVGELSPSSTVEWRLMQGGGQSGLTVRFTRAAPIATQSIWTGATNNDWLTASNWCTSVPSSTIDALIPAAGPVNMPVITGAATTKNITINPAIAAGTYTSLIPAASLTLSGASTLSVFGNWVNNGTFAPNTGAVTFSGNTATTISSALPQTFYDLIFNKTNTSNNTSILSVSNSATFTSGIVTQNGALNFLSAATTSGANNLSFVTGGPVTKVGTAGFAFPIGGGGFYAPLTISAAGGSNLFSAQYFKANPNPSFPVASKDPSLDHVSQLEYWNLTRVSGSTDVTVNLQWNANSGVTAPLSDLRVAGWDGSVWQNRGGSVVGGSTATSGSVSTPVVVSMYGPFTLASIAPSNPLPIQLKEFNARYDAGAVIITWKTESELNNDFFTVQRTDNVESFIDLIRVTGNGTSTAAHSYSTIDEQPIVGKSYYRLKQTDFDKKFTYSSIVAVTTPESIARKAFPNPTIGSDFNVSFARGDAGKSASIKLNDMEGKELLQVIIQSISSTSLKIEVPQKLASGMYIVSIAVGTEIVKQKLIVR